MSIGNTAGGKNGLFAKASSTPLVLIHGFMGGSLQWQSQRRAWGDAREIITPDLPGFGANNAAVAPNTINGFAEYVLAELDSQGVKQFDLLGHSMGGMIAQEMVALAPQRVQRLVLYGTAAAGDLPGRFESFATSRQRALEEGVDAFADRVSATWFLDYQQAPGYPECAALARRLSAQALQAALTALETWSRRDNLEKISCPTLILWGEHDRTYRWSQIHELWSQIPDSHLAALPNCAHAVHLEKELIFNALVADFLS